MGFFNELKSMKKTPIKSPEIGNLPLVQSNNFSAKIIPSELQESCERQEEKNVKDKLLKDIYVLNWVDYSTKYGVGYLLTNGFTGVFFNDSSKMLMKDENFCYYIDKNHPESDDLMEYHVNNCPPELHKKIVLLKHFKSYLYEHLEVRF